MERLLEIGFELAGRWLLDGDRLLCELSEIRLRRNLLYAFVCDGEVKYVGKTTNTLAKRMAGYRYPHPTQLTNIGNYNRIMEQLRAGVIVEIYALPDAGFLHYGQFHLNLASGLEDDIISKLNPEWNGGTKEDGTVAVKAAPSVIEPIGLGPDEVQAGEQLFSDSFPLVVQPTYAAKGFFNVRVEHAKLIGGHGEKIEIFCGSDGKPIVGMIDRRSQGNGTPRIQAGLSLRTWFQQNASVMQEITVQVASPNIIRLVPQSSPPDAPEVTG